MRIRFQTLLSLILALLLSSASFSASRLLTITHDSPALGKKQVFLVLMPEEVKPGQQFPVLYLLHGAYGGETDWTERTDVEKYVADDDLIVVMPSAGPFSWYMDSPREATSAAETYITKELIPLVDSTLPTIPSREGRGICGLSMGGHGALLLAAKHPDLFSSASSLSGILRITNHAGRWHLIDRLGPMDASPEVWQANSVYELADRFVGSDVALLFDTGREDETGAVEDCRQTHERMNALSVPHTYEEFPGTHSWSYWDEHIVRHLAFHEDDFARRLGYPVSARQKAEREAMGRWERHYWNRVDEFRRENANLKREHPELRTVVLLGSSSVEQFCQRAGELLPGWLVLNRGIAADGLGVGERGIRNRLKESVYDCQPAHVFLLNGRNDLGNLMRSGSPALEKIIDCYRGVVEDIQRNVPGVKVHIISSPPTRDKYEQLNPLIVQFNRELKKMARELKVDFIDLHSRLKGRSGLLRPEYSRDGLHLSNQANEIWAEEMRKELGEDSGRVPKGQRDKAR